MYYVERKYEKVYVCALSMDKLRPLYCLKKYYPSVHWERPTKIHTEHIKIRIHNFLPAAHICWAANVKLYMFYTEFGIWSRVRTLASQGHFDMEFSVLLLL